MAKKIVKIEVEQEQDQGNELVPESDDNKVIPKSSCALWSIFLILFIILLAIIGSLFYLKTKKFSVSTPKVNVNINSELSASTSGETISIKLTEAQIQSAINTNDANFPLKKATVKVNPDKIVLSGKTSNKFWGVLVEVGLVPRVESGKVVFDITEIKSAGVTAPKSISDLVNKNLGQYLDGLSSSLGNIEVSKVGLNSGFIMVTGKQR